MIPRIPKQSQLKSDYQLFLEALKSSVFSGDVESSYANRLAVATDNSIYQSLPQAIVLPKSLEDIQYLAQLAQQSRFSDIRFSARGGGTGTNGQSLTSGIIVDLSRYMNEIIEINVAEKWVKVQAGVVKDQLNAFLKPHGFFFAPDLSTSNRATIAGMINTDASGQGSLVYGKTSDHVLGLTSVLVNGDVIKTQPIAMAKAQCLSESDTAEGRIYNQVLTSCMSKREQILAKFPRMNRFLTGYDLEHVFDDSLSHFDLSRVITGSEGSLAFVAEAKLNITPIPTFKTLVNVKYDSFDSALRNAPSMIEAKATSVETIDSRVLNLAREDIVWHSVKDMIADVPGKDMQGLNVVEYNSEDADDISHKLAVMCENLDNKIANGESGVIGYQVTSDLPSIEKMYAMRKKAVGLLGATKGAKKPIAFAEDTGVPPENLADFIAEFRALLDSYGLKYGMFGHVDAGVLHVRPAMDMCDPEQEVLLRTISDKVVALTAKYGGLMWGEHGKGYRSEYAEQFFGSELFTELRKIKASFDPDNRMNPGKICTPLNSTESLVSVDDTKRGFYDRQIDVAVKQEYPGAMECNGNGLCFNFDTKSPMCPSFKVTGNRIHSPKGRAGLMREWLRLAEAEGADLNQVESDLAKGKGGASWFQKWKNSIGRKNGEYDFNHEVKEAMDGCLACKACSSQCPIKVDVPTFRSRFLQFYHSRYPRPLKDYLVAGVEGMAPAMSKIAPVVNAGLGFPPLKWIVERTTGYVDMPKLSVPAIHKRDDVASLQKFNLPALASLSDEDKANTVLIVQDPFVSFYDTDVLEDTIKLALRLGKKPVLLPFKPNGKPQHVKGFLRQFAKTATNSAGFLNQVHALGIDMIGLDASMVLCYRDEYSKLLKEKRGDFEVLLVHEWLLKDLDNLAAKYKSETTAASSAPFYLFSHCTEKTALPNSEADWQRIYKALGLSMEKVSVGCCGMAGTYGHESQNLDNSTSIFDMSWKGAIKDLEHAKIVATGFSCRSQVKRLEAFKPKHPIQALLSELNR